VMKLEKDLIINGSLIIAFLFIAGQMSKDNEISPRSSLKLRLIAGFIFGLLGSCLMVFSIKVSDTIIIDMRYIALTLAALCGGPVSAFVSVILMAITRVALSGFNEASVIAVITLVILAVCSIFILKMKGSEQSKYWLMLLLSILFIILGLNIVLHDKIMLLYFLLSFLLIFIVVGFFSYWIYTYIQNSNDLYRRYKVESKIDFLTGLYNLRQFEELFASQIQIVKEGSEQLSVMTIDIDHFKKVNDTYGHPSGDKVLQKLGAILKNTTRRFDIVARYGGEEFMILLLDCPNQRAIEIAERIRSTVEKEKFPISDGEFIHITISIGVSSFPETIQNLNELLKQADAALYEAKRSGRNQVCSLHG
jgi:diguanylate cyclase